MKSIRDKNYVRSQWIWIGAFCAILALTFDSCLWPDSGNGSLEKITIAEGTQPIAGPVYVAFAKGYFKKEGLDVTLQAHMSGKACLDAVIAGKADLGTVAETPIMYAALRGEKTYTIATIHSANANTVVVGRKDRGILAPGDLLGKKIGVTAGTNGAFFLDSFLISHGILGNAIETVDLRPEEMYDALTTEIVDAVATWNPHVIKLQRALGDRAVTFSDRTIYTETFNIVGMQASVAQHPETVKKVLRALIRAEDLIQKNQEESVNIIAEHIKMDRTLLGDLWAIYNFQIELDQSLIITLENQARWAIQKKLTVSREIPNYLDFLYPNALEEVKPEVMTVIH